MNKKNITAINNPLIKDLYHELHVVKKNLIIIESLKVIEELINNHQHIKYLLCTQTWFDQNKFRIDNVDFIDELIIVNNEILDKLCFVEKHHDVIIISNLNLDTFDVKENGKYIIFDHIQDPNNLSTMIRTSVGFNFKEIFISKNSVSLYNEKLIRGTMGSIFKIKVNYYDDLNQLILMLQKHNIEVIASCLNKDAKCIEEVKLKKHQGFALIFGNESNGINEQAIKLCNQSVYIKINNIDSLNVASAFAIFALWFSLNK